MPKVGIEGAIRGDENVRVIEEATCTNTRPVAYFSLWGFVECFCCEKKGFVAQCIAYLGCDEGIAEWIGLYLQFLFEWGCPVRSLECHSEGHVSYLCFYRKSPYCCPMIFMKKACSDYSLILSRYGWLIGTCVRWLPQ